MKKALQIRDVPHEVRDLLARRAAARNQSMQAYLLSLVEREARGLRNAESFDRTASHRVVIPPELAPERLIREGREEGFEKDRHSDEVA